MKDMMQLLDILIMPYKIASFMDLVMAGKFWKIWTVIILISLD